MAIINRASLGEEFYDVTAAKMLVQPEPQYFFAAMAKASLASALMLAMGSFGVTPDRAIPSQGESASQYQANARLILADPDPQDRQAIQTITEIGKAPGHTVRLNRPRYGSGGFTLASREITSGSSISTTGIDLGSEQVSLTLKRYGGPYDASVQNAVAPFVVDKFDSTVALHSFVDIVSLHMQRDLDKWLDNVFSVFFGSGSTTLWPQGFTADSQSTQVGDMPMDVDLLFRSVETLKNASIPTFANGRYRAVLSPTQGRQLKNDPEFQRLVAFATQSKNPLTGADGVFIGSIPGLDIYEATTLQVANNGNSIPITTGVVFGPGMVGQGYGKLPHLAFSTDDNYGEAAKVVWLEYAAYGLLDYRFALQLHTS